MKIIETITYKMATDYQTMPGFVPNPSVGTKGIADELMQDEEGGVDSEHRIKKRWRRPIGLPTKRVYQTGVEVPVVEPKQGL